MNLRHASKQDARFLYDLRLNPAARRFQKNTGTFSYSSHLEWLSASLRNKKRVIYIAFQDKNRIGMIRFDIKRKTALVSVAVSPSFRSQGFGQQLILVGCNTFFSQYKLDSIKAVIDEKNIASTRAFTTAGFKLRRKFMEEKRNFLEMIATRQSITFDAAIIGFGSIGQRHANNLLKLGKRVIVYDPLQQPLQKAREAGYAVISSFEDLLSLSNAVVICSPPVLHIPHAVAALSLGKATFIEKPLSANVNGIKQLFLIAKSKHTSFFVGCNLRFTQGLQKVKKLLEKNAIGRVVSTEINFGYYLPLWRPGTDYRKNYAASRKAGGGIMLDAIHEIDYAIWLFGFPEEIFAVYGKKSDLEIETEDYAEIFGNFGSNARSTPVHIHLDYLNKKYTRYCRIIGEKGEIYWNFADKALTISLQGEKAKRIKLNDDIDLNKMYVKEMKFFLRNMHAPKTLFASSLISSQAMFVVDASRKSNGLKVVKVKQLRG